MSLPSAGLPSAGCGTAARVFASGLTLLLLLAAPVLWSHESRSPTLFGRYSPAYLLFLLVYSAAAAACLLVAVSPSAAAGRWTRGLERSIQRALRRGRSRRLAIGSLWLLAGGMAVYFKDGSFGRSVTLHVVGLAAVLWISFALLFASLTDARSRARAAAKYAICLLFLGTGFALIEAVLQAKPGLLPTALLFNLPGRGDGLSPHYDYDEEITVGFRYKPGISISDRLRSSDSNLYLEHAGLVRPVPPEEDKVLTGASFITDEIGYRNQSPLKETYPIVASGDSFTSHAIDPEPWPEILSRRLGEPVLNLGLQGYGPHSEVEALIRFGIPRKPRWIILAWYEGNDLYDAQGYDRKKESGLAWDDYHGSQGGLLGRSLTFHLAAHGLRLLLPAWAEDQPPGAAHPYPFSIDLEGKRVELGFSHTYLSCLSMPQPVVESLRSFESATGSLKRLKAEAEKLGARVLVAYCPTKEHCYVQLLSRSLLEEKLAGAKRYEVSPQADLLRASAGKRLLSASELLSSIDGQRNALAERLQKEDIEFLDLTPELQAAAARGTQLYWPTDNHWTPEGTRLAASIIERRLRRDLEPPPGEPAVEAGR